jgi:hypothetical protein
VSRGEKTFQAVKLLFVVPIAKSLSGPPRIVQKRIKKMVRDGGAEQCLFFPSRTFLSALL